MGLLMRWVGLSKVGQEMGGTSRKGLTYQHCVIFAESNSQEESMYIGKGVSCDNHMIIT